MQAEHLVHPFHRKLRQVRPLCLAMVLALTQTACGLWPQRPVAKTEVARVEPVPAAQAWWTRWNDPILNQLQDRLLAQNPGVQIASAKVRQAQAAVQASEASLWPTVNLQPSATRSQTGNAAAVNTINLTAAMSWEIDVWGRLADAERASQARKAASQSDLALARVSAQATLVQLYVQLRAAERQLSVLSDTEAAQKRALELTQAREEAGVSSTQDVVQARLQWRNTQVQRLEVLSTHANLQHALAVLMGDDPLSLAWAQTGQLPAFQPLPEVISADVLKRRPDVASAQASVLAAQASVGVAQKAFFPALNFAASTGYKSADLANLIGSPSRLWSLGPSLVVNLVDGGARRAATEQAMGVLDQAAAAYRQTVLGALQEVQDNLVPVCPPH